MAQIAKAITGFLLILLFAASYGDNRAAEKMERTMTAPTSDTISFKSGYSDVHGLRMYYEIYGEGAPLVVIHGGGSTIQSSFGRIIPQLAKHRQIIGVELQAHGRTNDRDTDLSFERDADDVAALLKNLNITKADFLGFSNGGSTTMQIAIRHPDIVNKIIVGSAFYKRSGVYPQIWGFIKDGTAEAMPQQYKDAYRELAPNPDLQVLHDKCVKRMMGFKDWSDEQIQSIKAPTLLVIGDADVTTPEHAVEIYRLIPNCQLAIIPGGHGEYIGEITALSADYKDTDFIVPMIEKFLDKTR